MLDTYTVPLHLKNKVKQIGFDEIDRIFELRFWQMIAIVGWILFFFMVGLYFFPDLEASEIRLSEHFTQSEFSCKCCGETKVNIQLIMALENLRKMVNAPIIITSGYRCLLHNKAIGGAKNSQHQYGNAVDIKIKGYTPAQVARLAKKCGFTWTKAYSGWTHIDIRPVQLTKRQK